jgi:hypothetical protein
VYIFSHNEFILLMLWMSTLQIKPKLFFLYSLPYSFREFSKKISSFFTKKGVILGHFLLEIIPLIFFICFDLNKWFSHWLIFSCVFLVISSSQRHIWFLIFVRCSFDFSVLVWCSFDWIGRSVLVNYRFTQWLSSSTMQIRRHAIYSDYFDLITLFIGMNMPFYAINLDIVS